MNNENRKEDRFLCVNIGLQYSPFSEKYINDLGRQIYSAAIHDMSLSGMSFDSNVHAQVNDIVYAHFKNSENNQIDRLHTRVCWCRESSPGLYRIGIKIEHIETIDGDHASMQNLNSISNDSVPDEIEIICPSCKNNSIMKFYAEQPVLEGKATIPLYNCSVCGTTRSLYGLLHIK